MNSSFLYHAWGLYNHKCTREEYKGNTIILHIEAKERKKECPKCGHRQLVKNGFRVRDFIGLPIGGKKVIIRMKVQWKSHATLTLLAKQDLAPFGYNMIDPLKSWCWGSILFYPFKISRFS